MSTTSTPRSRPPTGSRSEGRPPNWSGQHEPRRDDAGPRRRLGRRNRSTTRRRRSSRWAAIGSLRPRPPSPTAANRVAKRTFAGSSRTRRIFGDDDGRGETGVPMRPGTRPRASSAMDPRAGHLLGPCRAGARVRLRHRAPAVPPRRRPRAARIVGGLGPGLRRTRLTLVTSGPLPWATGAGLACRGQFLLLCPSSFLLPAGVGSPTAPTRVELAAVPRETNGLAVGLLVPDSRPPYELLGLAGSRRGGPPG